MRAAFPEKMGIVSPDPFHKKRQNKPNDFAKDAAPNISLKKVEDSIPL
jgi:hypothetical protein